MSYSISYFLTVLLLAILISGVGFAQQESVKRELDQLAAPAAWQRSAAINRLASIKDDIDADLRVAWKTVQREERIGLLQVAQIRHSDALLQQAAVGLSNTDETLVAVSRDYLLSLPLQSLTPNTDKLTEAQADVWRAFYSLRVQRDVARALLEAHMMPGKYFGQFDDLRQIDAERLDRVLLGFVRCDTELIEALNLASCEATDDSVPAERTYDANWRKLQTAAGMFEPAMLYLQTMEKTKAVKAALKPISRNSFLGSLAIASGVRTAAARALAQSQGAESLRPELDAYYGKLLKQKADAEYANVLDPEDLRQEIELTLARFGDDRLLQARIATLRSQIERVDGVRSNVNMAASSHPDLITQNQIAHLLLRSGDFAGAEKEWTAGVATALVMLRDSDGRNRSSLSSYLAAVYYNLACTQSLLLKLSKGLHSLKEAVRYGYKDFSWMLEDGDLQSVRQFEGFDEWFEDVAPPSIADRLHSDS